MPNDATAFKLSITARKSAASGTVTRFSDKTCTYALALSFFLCGNISPQAFAADFSKTQKTYVPPSVIDRRVDFSSLREHQALENASPSASQLESGKPTATPAPKSAHPTVAKHSSPTALKHSSAKSSGSHPTPHTVAAHAVGKPPSTAASSSLENMDFNRASAALQRRFHKIANSPTTAVQLASLKKQADELIKSGKLDEAKQTLGKVLQLTPHDKQLLQELSTISVERAKQLANSQNFEQAKLYARHALALDSNSPQANKLLDGLIARGGENPSDVGTRLRTAEELAAAGRREEAAVEYDAALRLKPNSEAHIGLAKMALQSNQRERAKSEFQQALEVDPNSGNAHRQMGLIKLNSGDIVGANSELSRALIINPGDTEAARTLTDLWQKQVSRVPSANSHLGLARAYLLAGDLNSAQAEYRTVAQIDPTNPHLTAARQAFKLALARQGAGRSLATAKTLESQGALMDAYGKVIEAQRLSPGDPELRVYQGQLLEKMQKSADARRAYLDALKLNPQHPQAAARLQQLPADEASASLATPPTLSPVSTGTALAAPAIASALGTGLPMVAAAAQPDPIGQLSNFAVQLRDHMVIQKTVVSKAEDAAHDMISKISQPAAPVGETLHTIGVADAGAAPIGGIGGDALGGSVNDALASAASAIAAAKGTSGKGSPTIAKSLPATVPAGSTDTAEVLAGLPSTATQSASNTKTKSPAANKTKVKQNTKKAAHQIAANPSVNSSLANSIPDTGGPALRGAMPPVAPPIASRAQNQTLDKVLGGSAFNPTAPAPIMAASLPVAQMGISDSSPIPQLQTQPIAMAPANDSAGSIKLGLETANVKMTGVELNVVLRNDGNTSIVLPDKLKAIIKYGNRKDAEVKASFTEGTVPAHGQVRGVIKVPFDKVDPHADLLIPGLLPPGNASRDVHLTTPIAFH